jgi:hypothetical protein
LLDHGDVLTPFPVRACVNFESDFRLPSCLNLEFGFALTGLEKLEAVVGLPDFSGPFSDEDYIGNQESHFQEHFASQIVLRRLVVEFHSVLNQGTIPSPFSSIWTFPDP